ncbi:MAG: hypothetical protein IPL46_26265 [Saprospiraceae bacterium]|nr:hypothetical protein [Saprospiraceae bacterium]
MKNKPDEITVAFNLPDGTISIIKHTLSLFENHFDVKFNYGQEAMIHVALEKEADIRISEKFIGAVERHRFNHYELMIDAPIILCEDGTPDYLSTCAYMVNFLQEYVETPDYFDEFDRFRFEKSYQYRFNCVTENLVLQNFIKLQQHCTAFKHLRRNTRPSKLWVSHDIDYLYHTIWPDLKTAIKKLRFDQIFDLLFSGNKKRPDQKIFEKIISINEKHGVTATFFWLANRNIFKTRSGDKIENANYHLDDPKVQDLINLVRDAGCELGVHQSLGCKSIIAEIEQIDQRITINRNHYLAGKLPDLWRSLEKTPITRDATAGFSAAMGFRNSYGSPCRPFDVVRNRPYDIEVYPLHIMDATFMNQRYRPQQAKKEIIDFMEKNKTDCTISFLWHNNYFSDVKFAPWITVYEEILRYARAQDYQ